MANRTGFYRPESERVYFDMIKARTGQSTSAVVCLLVKLYVTGRLTHPDLPPLRQLPESPTCNPPS